MKKIIYLATILFLYSCGSIDRTEEIVEDYCLMQKTVNDLIANNWKISKVASAPHLIKGQINTYTKSDSVRVITLTESKIITDKKNLKVNISLLY